MDSELKTSEEYKRDFKKLLSSVKTHKSEREVFSDFLTLGFTALVKPTLVGRGDQQADQMEKRYMDVVGLYEKGDIREIFPRLLAITMVAVHTECDFLGELSGEYSLLNSKQGQFFTPYTVCSLCASITANDIRKTLNDKKFVTVQEPAVGGGAMLIALADHLKRSGVDVAKKMWVDATDVSEHAVMMSYIQCNFRGISGVFRHGNSLSMEMWGSYVTHHGMNFLAEHKNPYKYNVKLNTALIKEINNGTK